MRKSVFADRYMIDVSDPTKADVDWYFNTEREFNKLNASTDRLRPNDKRAPGILQKAKKIFMDYTKNRVKIQEMIKRKMLGPYLDDFRRLDGRWKGIYQNISSSCVAAKNGKDPSL